MTDDSAFVYTERDMRAIIQAERERLGARLDAIMRWLVDEGHMTPMAVRQIRNVLGAAIGEQLEQLAALNAQRDTVTAEYGRAVREALAAARALGYQEATKQPDHRDVVLARARWDAREGEMRACADQLAGLGRRIADLAGQRTTLF